MQASVTIDHEVILQDEEGAELLRLSGEEAVKLGHELIHSGEKALRQAGKLRES